MSQANVEIVKQAIDAYNRRDIDAYIALTTSDFELFPALDRTVEARSYRGHEGIETHLRDIGETGRNFACSLKTGAILATGYSCSVGCKDAGVAAACRSMRALGSWSIFAAESSRASAPSSTATRRCERLAFRSSDQVPVSGV